MAKLHVNIRLPHCGCVQFLAECHTGCTAMPYLTTNRKITFTMSI